MSSEVLANPTWEAFEALKTERFLKDKLQEVSGLKENINSQQIDQLEYHLVKQGPSQQISKIAGPSAKLFKNLIDHLPEDDQETFLRAFLQGWFQYSEIDGNIVTFKRKSEETDQAIKARMNSEKFLKFDKKYGSKDFANIPISELQKIFTGWLNLSQDSVSSSGRPFSFLAHGTKMRILEGQFPGISKENVDLHLKEYEHWLPHYGKAEELIQGFSPSIKEGSLDGGVKIDFHPIQGHGAYHQVLEWYEKEMGPRKRIVDLENHHRVVLPTEILGQDLRRLTANTEKIKQEILTPYSRIMQAYSLINNLVYNDDSQLILQPNIQTSLNNDQEKIVLNQDSAVSLNVLNSKKNTLYKLAINFDFSTRHGPTQNFLEETFLSRFLTHKWDDLKNFESVDFSPGTPKKIAERLGIEQKNVRLFLAKLAKVRTDKGHKINFQSLLPLWNWQNAPFLTWKKEFIGPLGQNFISQILSQEPLTYEDVRDALKTWTKATDLAASLENYIKPADWDDKIDHEDPLNFVPNKSSNQAYNYNKVEYPVNDIGIGIEYTTRYPMKSQSEFVGRLQDQSFHFIRHKVNFSLEKRNEVIKEVAKRLNKTMSDGVEEDIVLDENPGHENSVAAQSFTFPDPRDFKKRWRVEWDGVQRTYPGSEELANKSKMMAETSRGGHLEIVSPLLKPSFADTKKLFKGLKENDLHPDRKVGGGHLNFNMAVFMDEKNPRPKELARFLALFLQHQGILTFLFTDMSRIRQNISPEVSPEFVKKLSDFKGSMTELLQLIYNERFFNTLIGRKSRYTLLNITNLFQSIIPRKLRTKDFDIKDPYTLWRPEFRVNPDTLKAEFRMMDAPLTAAQSALQIKLFRALFYKALNKNDTLSGKQSQLNYSDYAENPNKAYTDLQNLLVDLDMDPKKEMKNYIGFLNDNIENTRGQLRSKYFRPLEEKLRLNVKAPEHIWGKALKEQDKEKINSVDHVWDKEEFVTREAENYNLIRQAAANEGMKLRNLALKQNATSSAKKGILVDLAPSWLKKTETFLSSQHHQRFNSSLENLVTFQNKNPLLAKFLSNKSLASSGNSNNSILNFSPTKGLTDDERKNLGGYVKERMARGGVISLPKFQFATSFQQNDFMLTEYGVVFKDSTKSTPQLVFFHKEIPDLAALNEKIISKNHTSPLASFSPSMDLSPSEKERLRKFVNMRRRKNGNLDLPKFALNTSFKTTDFLITPFGIVFRDPLKEIPQLIFYTRDVPNQKALRKLIQDPQMLDESLCSSGQLELLPLSGPPF